MKNTLNVINVICDIYWVGLKLLLIVLTQEPRSPSDPYTKQILQCGPVNSRKRAARTFLKIGCLLSYLLLSYLSLTLSYFRDEMESPCCTCSLFHLHIILYRLLFFLESSSIFSPHQATFHPSRFTLD